MPDPASDARLARRQRVAAALIAALFAFAWHRWVGDAHFNAAEEGYLWHGTWRAGMGDLPLRDYQSYDPGRYFACAALGKVFGDGLLGLRRSIAVFHALGLFLGLLAARRATRSVGLLVPIGIVLGMWMFPRQKVFEGAFSLAGTWAGVRLLESPTRARHLAAGACVGVTAFFGRNLGLYSALGLLLLIAANALRRRDGQALRNALAWCGGVVLGYSPMLVLFLVPGFLERFVDSLLLLRRLGTNIAEPWLWPWALELAALDTLGRIGRIALGAVYLLPVVVLPLGLVALALSRAEDLRRRALLLAGSALGVFYMHHAAVRSDPSHLAQAIQPTLLAAVGALALLHERSRRAAALLSIAIGVLAAVAAYWHNPALEGVEREDLVPVELAGDTLRLLPAHADYHARLRRTLEQHVAPEDAIFFAPSRPGFYPLFGKRPPSWWVYFFVPEPDREEQESIVADLGDVEWVLIVDTAIGDRQDLRFGNSYPLVWIHITSSYRRVPTPELEPNHLLYRRQ